MMGEHSTKDKSTAVCTVSTHNYSNCRHYGHSVITRLLDNIQYRSITHIFPLNHHNTRRIIPCFTD